MLYHAEFGALCAALEGAGAFLVVEAKGRVNPMTIGWAQAGFVWGLPVMTVLVRASRYTHSLMGAAARFSVCVPAPGEMRKELAYCGSKSGRDYDKVRACGLELRDGSAPGVKLIGGCALAYECEKTGSAELRAEDLPGAVRARYYPEGDLHTLFFGRIIKAENFR